MLRASNFAPLVAAEAAKGAEARRAAAELLNDHARAAMVGDEFALRRFLQAIEPLVRRICRGVIGGNSPDLEDAIQESLIDLARGLPRFRFESSVSHYATRIALRRALASRRRWLARWKQHTTLDIETLPVPDAESGAQARAEHLRKLLDGLNEKQATALLLRVIMGHSIEEIAEITGVPVNTVKTRLRLGKNQLRRWLEQSGEVRRAGD